MRTHRDTVLISHDAVFGDHTHAVSRFKISEVKPFAHYAQSVSIFWMTPKARKRWRTITVVPNNTLFYTIQREEDVLYDSRSDISCDMDEFAKKKSEHQTKLKPPMSFAS